MKGYAMNKQRLLAILTWVPLEPVLLVVLLWAAWFAGIVGRHLGIPYAHFLISLPIYFLVVCPAVFLVHKWMTPRYTAKKWKWANLANESRLFVAVLAAVGVVVGLVGAKLMEYWTEDPFSFWCADGDRDGRLSAQEFCRYHTPRYHYSDEEGAKWKMDQTDLNNDGYISREEWDRR